MIILLANQLPYSDCRRKVVTGYDLQRVWHQVQACVNRRRLRNFLHKSITAGIESRMLVSRKMFYELVKQILYPTCLSFVFADAVGISPSLGIMQIIHSISSLGYRRSIDDKNVLVLFSRADK